tara:strand:+ start:564 stop:719 length:156 start_codon:yes stop_codon:yes gene_type:complete
MKIRYRRKKSTKNVLAVIRAVSRLNDYNNRKHYRILISEDKFSQKANIFFK